MFVDYPGRIQIYYFYLTNKYKVIHCVIHSSKTKSKHHEEICVAIYKSQDWKRLEKFACDWLT